MTQLLLFDNSYQRVCVYKGERYSVRNDGSVFRHKLNGRMRKRPLDEIWTFGNKNEQTGYMTIGGARVHIIVASAFHGAHDSSIYVVDHIDTNRCNNRPENLRWVTRLENIINNPITKKKIEYIYGDINSFIKNPKRLRHLTSNSQDVGWMRPVSQEESLNTIYHLINWVNSPIKKPEGGTIGEWIYRSNIIIKYNDSLTDNAKQVASWKTPTSFPLCPLGEGPFSIHSYIRNLGVGKVITHNIHSTHYIDEFQLYNEIIHVRAHTIDELKNHSLISITLIDNMFVHEGRTFWEEKGAKKYFCKAIGKEWCDGNCIDDYC